MLSVLALTSEPPWPLDSGGCIRTFHLMHALAAAFDLRLVCPMTPNQQPAVKELATRGIRVVPANVGPRTPFGELRRLGRARLSGEPYVLYRRHARPEVVRTFTDELTRLRPSVVYLDHLDSFQYAEPAKRLGIPVVLDLHNVYSTLTRRTAEEQRSFPKRWFLRGEAERLAVIERRAVNEVDLVFAVSETEAEHFRSIGGQRVQVVPNGVDCGVLASLPTGRMMQQPVMLYVGTMSWQPNAEAARFLATQVLPRVQAVHPAASLLVVGKGPGPELLRLQERPGVEVVGAVPSVVPHLGRASVLAVPLEAGGGTRLKILEAFAAGLPVVSTAIGAEGITAEPGRHFAQATRDEFADAVLELSANPTQATQLAEAARRLARENYDWSAIGAGAVAGIQRLLNPQKLPDEQGGVNNR